MLPGSARLDFGERDVRVRMTTTRTIFQFRHRIENRGGINFLM